MERSSHKTTREREGQQIHRPIGDGLKTLLTEKALSEELRIYFEEIIGLIENPSAKHPTICPLSIQPDKEPIRVTRRRLKLSEVNLFIHPLAEIQETIVETTPRAKPRGRFKGDKLIVAPSIGLRSRDLVSSLEYFDEELLREDLNHRPFWCLELNQNNYLFVDSVRRLAELQDYGYSNIPFLISKYSANGSRDLAILRTLRRAFESLRDDPSFLRPEVRRRLLSILVSVGLAPLIFNSSTLSAIYKVMQISGSTTRAGRSRPVLTD